MQGRFVQRKLVDGCPQVQHIPVRLTIRMEAAEHLLAQVDRERWAGVRRLAVQRARASALQAAAAHSSHQA